MKKKIDICLKVLGIVMILLIVKLFIDFLLDLSSDTLAVYIFGALIVVVFLVVAKMITGAIEKREVYKSNLEMRKIKIEYYHQFLDTLYYYLKDRENKQFMDKFYHQISILPLYASEEVIAEAEQLKTMPVINTTHLYELIRSDLVSNSSMEIRDLSLFSFGLK